MTYMAAAVVVASRDGPFWADEVTAIATAVTAFLAFWALVGAVWQLKDARTSTRETRAQDYLQRYDDPQLIPFVEKARFVIGPKRELTVAERRARQRWWDHLSFRDQFEVQIALNFWEQMGGMYNRELVDQRLIEEYFGDAALDYWRRAEWLVHHIRDQSPGEAVYNEWDDMCEEILNRRQGGWPRTVRRFHRKRTKR